MQAIKLLEEIKPILDKIGAKYSQHPGIEHMPDAKVIELESFLEQLKYGPIAEYKKVRASQTEDQWAAYELYLDAKDVEDFHEMKLLKDAENKIKAAMKMRPKLLRYAIKKEANAAAASEKQEGA